MMKHETKGNVQNNCKKKIWCWWVAARIRTASFKENMFTFNQSKSFCFHLRFPFLFCLMLKFLQCWFHEIDKRQFIVAELKAGLSFSLKLGRYEILRNETQRERRERKQRFLSDFIFCIYVERYARASGFV